MSTTHDLLADDHHARSCPTCRAKSPVLAALADAHEAAVAAADYGAAVAIAHQMDIQQLTQSGYTREFAVWLCDGGERGPGDRPLSGKAEVDAECRRKAKAEVDAYKTAEAARKQDLFFRPVSS